ncbi:MAG: hypothetical protein ACOCUU_01080 [Nanoarchaeota archaeon]
MFGVFTTREFDKDFNKLDNSEKKKINKIMNQLKSKGERVDKLGKGLGSSVQDVKRFDGYL